MPKTPQQHRKLSPKQARDLDIEIAFLAGLVRKAPDFIEALQLLGDDYTRRGLFQEGLEVDRKLEQLLPEDPLVRYNLACSYALTAQLEAAATALLRALDLGYSDFDWLQRDPDLKGLRQHALYQSIRERIRHLA